MLKISKDLDNALFAHMFYFKLSDYDEKLINIFVDNCVKYLSNYEDQIHFSVGLRDLDIKRNVSALNFEIAVNMIFKNKQAYIEYSKAERHQEFITQVAGMSTDRTVYDSFLLYNNQTN